MIGAHDAKEAPPLEETLLDPALSATESTVDAKKNGISKKPARCLEEPRGDDHPGWAALSPDKRTKLSESDAANLPEGIAPEMLMEDAQAPEGDVLEPEAAPAAPSSAPLLPPPPPPFPEFAAAAAPRSTPPLHPPREPETISSTTDDSPLPSPDDGLDGDSCSSSWTRKPPHPDECEDEEDATATKKDWNEYVFKKQADRMSRLFPNPDLEETEPFASTFVPKIPPRVPAADAVNVGAELEEMELEEVPAPGATSFNPDPDRRQENGRLSPAPDTPDDENLLLLDNRMLKNNILKAMDVRQDTTEALFNRVANQMITNQDFTTNSIVGIETKITSLSTCTAKLPTDMKKHAKDQSAKTDRIDIELNSLKASLHRRHRNQDHGTGDGAGSSLLAATLGLGLRTGGAEAAERHC